MCATGARANAQTAPAISGRVVDAETGDPLVFCNILLKPSPSGTVSLDDGTFAFESVPPGRYQLVVSYIGYREYSDSVSVVQGIPVALAIELVPTVLETDAIVVTASRKEQTARQAPATVSIVTREDINNQQVTTFDQALESVTGVAAFRSVPISVQSMQIRGSSDVAGGGVGNRVLLLVDGRPALTSDSGGAFWSLVPTNFVDRVEVVKGAFSSLYGSTAMGGVVNVITRRPDYASRAQVDLKYGFFEKAPPEVRYTDDLQTQSEAQLSYSGKAKRLGYILSASRKQSDGHAMGTAYDFYDIYAKGIFDLQENRNLEITIGGGAAKNDYPHSWLNSAEPLEIREKYRDDRQEKNYATTDIWYWAIPSSHIKYSTRFYYHRHEQLSFFNEDDPLQTVPGNELFGTQTSIKGDKLGAIAQLDAYFGRHYLVGGVDTQVDHVKSAPDTVMYGNQQINDVALFAQDEVSLPAHLTATLGLRYDSNHLVGGKTFDQMSPKLGLLWAPDRRVSFRALYGRAFRAPTIAELFLQRELAGGVDFVPNPGLQPEHMTLSLEGGVRWNPAGTLTIDAAAYRYEYEDMIFWENVSNEFGVGYPLYQVRNLNSALMQGGDVTLATNVTQYIRVSSNYTYLDARDRSPGRENDALAYRPKNSFGFAADAQWSRYMLHADTRYRSAIDEVYLFPLQAPDAFWVTNANLRYRLGEHLTLSARVNNVFDRQYEELARYRMPGRNWMFGISARM